MGWGVGAPNTSIVFCPSSLASIATSALGHGLQSLNSIQRVSSLHAMAEIMQLLDRNTVKKVYTGKYSNCLCGFANVVPITIRRDWAF